MTTTEELILVAIGATEDRKKDALKLLKGEARLADPLEPVPIYAPLLLTMGKAAKYLGVSRPTLWRMIKEGRLEKVEMRADSYRLRRRDIEALAMGRRIV